MPETRIVAIVNVTQDSFSDGGAHLDPNEALAAIGRAIDEGAHVIDIGAESTRPGAAPVGHEEEWRRLEPVLKELRRFDAARVPFSLDTRHGETALKALDYGIRWINDVSGFSDAGMVKAAAQSQCTLVVMHSLGIPAGKDIVLPEGTDVMRELIAFARRRIGELEEAGIERERIIFDPGVGFGKTAAQSITIIEQVATLKEIGVPILIGHSRKSFLSSYAGGVYASRDEATLAVSQLLAEAGIEYIRVHDVAAHAQRLGLHRRLHHA